MPTPDSMSPTVLVSLNSEKEARAVADVLLPPLAKTRLCKDAGELATCLNESVDVIVLAKEICASKSIAALQDLLKRQPALSEIPLLFVIDACEEESATKAAMDCFGANAHTTLLTRPLQPAMLLAAARAAIRTRRQQRQLSDLLLERETLLSGISEAFSVINRDFRYIYVNSKVAEMAGLSKEEMLGQVIWDVFPNAVGGEFHTRTLRAMETRQPDHFQIFYEPWGRWLETRIYPAREGLAIFRADISEQKQREEQIRESTAKLKESEDRLRSAVEAADIGTFDFYPPTGELRWSSRCNELFGLSPGAKVNYAAYINGIHPEDRHIITETVQGVLEPGNNGFYDIEYRTIGIEDRKERWLSEKGRAILDASGHATRFIGTLIDITEQKHAAIALQRAKKEAEEANRAKDQFLAMLSHELRTPLTPVLMTIAALRRDPRVSDMFHQDLEVLQRNVELEALLIDDLLDLTRIAHGKLKLNQDATDVHMAIDRALSISSDDLAQKELEVSRRFEAQEHHAWADAGRLQQVFWNLIKNAVKFTPAGGKISISTRNASPHRLIIEVEDTGIGIRRELQSRVFEEFYQGDRTGHEHGGLGLGLAICKRVVDLHHGKISVESAGAGQGSKFIVELQAMETSLLEGPAYLLDFQTGSGGPAEILLVEDHEDTARVVRRILEKAGYNVGYASNLAEARKLASARAFDLVISDVGLPDGTGLDLMRQLRDRHGLKGIALSGFGSDEDLAASKAAGFIEHLTKPVDWERLREAITRILAEEKKAQPAVG